MSRRKDELNRFVRESLAKGSTRSELQNVLQQAGWPQLQVEAALNAYSRVDFVLPVPAPKQYISARETFLYLLLFTTLYLSSYGLGSTIFGFIDQAFSDPLRADHRVERAIRWGISLLVVASPIFLFVAHQIRRMLKADPAMSGTPTRKWLTYLALFVAAAFLIGDIATLVNRLLGGELTIPFILKVTTVMAIAGLIFGYYLFEIKRDDHS